MKRALSPAPLQRPRARYWIRALGMALGLSALSATSPAGPLRPIEIAPGAVTVDGVVGEWAVRWEPLKYTLYGNEFPKGVTEAALGYNSTHLYLALRVPDRAIARQTQPDRKQDHAIVYLSFPKPGGGYRTSTVRVFPGKPGHVAGTIRVDGRPVKGSRTVEAKNRLGFTMEAKIPWSALGRHASGRVGVHAAIRYVDAGQPGRVDRIVATATGKAGDAMPVLLFPGDRALAQRLRERRLSPVGQPRMVQIAKGEPLEHLGAYGNEMIATGADIGGGRGLTYAKLRGTARRFVVRDLTGDGLDEVCVWSRLESRDGRREAFQILQIRSGRLVPLFEHEVRVATKEGHVENVVGFPQGSAFEVQAKEARGYGLGRPVPPPPEAFKGVPPVLKPWAFKSRSFKWDGAKFVVASEQAAPPPEHLASPRFAKPSDPGKSPSKRRRHAEKESAQSAHVIAQLLDAYQAEEGLVDSHYRYDQTANLVGGPEAERAVVAGTRLVVAGVDLSGGPGYAFAEIRDALQGTVAKPKFFDVTGDKRSEIILRVTQDLETANDQTATRELYLVYQVAGGKLRRLFAGEVERRLGSQRLKTRVAFNKARKGNALELHIQPYRAKGWTQETYPFNPAPDAATVEPILLPWQAAKLRVYRFNGTSFTHSADYNTHKKKIARE